MSHSASEDVRKKRFRELMKGFKV